jgi:hypothetical protein
MTPIQSWKDLMVRLPELTEVDLIVLINYEVSLYRRQAILRRLHSRFNMLRSARERDALIKGEMLL